MKLLSRILESWDEFLWRMHDERATEALEALVNDDDAMEKFAAEELEWQPYPVEGHSDREDWNDRRQSGDK